MAVVAKEPAISNDDGLHLVLRCLKVDFTCVLRFSSPPSALKHGAGVAAGLLFPLAGWLIGEFQKAY